MKFFCIADEDTVRGFRLAGVAGRAVASSREAEQAVVEAAGQSDLGVLIITEQVAAGIVRQLESIRLERDQPLIVEIPGPEGALPRHRSLAEVVQEAVGVRLDQGEET